MKRARWTLLLAIAALIIGASVRSHRAIAQPAPPEDNLSVATGPLCPEDDPLGPGMNRFYSAVDVATEE